jgi:hypothetical protein
MLHRVIILKRARLHFQSICDYLDNEFGVRKFSIIAPQGMGQGTMEVLVDGKHVGEVSFVKQREVKHQSVVFTSKKLRKGKHEIQLKNKNGMVAIDAIIIQ